MKRIVALLLAAFAVAAAFTIARPQGFSGAPLRDFEAYYAAGEAWSHGADPYGTAIWQYEKTLPGVDAKRYELLPFAGPPATLPLWAALARLPYVTAAVVWRAFLAGAVFVLVWLALTLGGARRTPFNLIALAIAALGFGALTNAYSLGQIALPVAATVGLAFAAVTFGGKVLAAATSFAQPNLGLALAGEFRHRRTALAVACGVALFGFLCAAINPNALFAYAQVLIAHGAAEQFSAIQLTPAAAAYGFGATDAAALTIGGAVATITTIAWLFAMIRLADRTTLFVISSALVPFASAFFHQHDLAIEFVPAVVLVLRAPPHALPAAITGALFCAANWIGLAQYPDAIVQTTLLAAAFAVALLLIRGDVRSRTLSAVGVAVFLIAFGGVVARAHAMPVWPAAMGALPNLSGYSASAVWHAEQVATGLFARNTIWALLRCASLAGCALLAFAAFNSKYLGDSRTSTAVPDRSP